MVQIRAEQRSCIPGLFGFCRLRINSLLSARLHTFPTIVKLASPDILGFKVYLIINLLPPARLARFSLLSAELASPGSFGFRFF